MHEESIFLTPTYSDEHLPADLSVSVATHQKFIKRCRKVLGPLRFFGVGEYGGRHQRPHYHTILFGVSLPDKSIWSKTGSGNYLYRSETIERLWPFGQCLIGSVNEQTAGYVARYCLKKVSGDAAAGAYARVNPETGETWQVRPEFVVMSRRPGIGAEWFERYAGDAFPSDFVIVDGVKRPVPRFYKLKLDERNQLVVSAKRKARARLHADNNTDRRLLVRDEVLRLKLAHFKRDLEV